MFRKVGKKYMETALIKLIAVGLIIGIVIALAAPGMVPVPDLPERMPVPDLQALLPARTMPAT